MPLLLPEQTLTRAPLAQLVNTLKQLVRKLALTVPLVNTLPIVAVATATRAVLVNLPPPMEKPFVPLAHLASSKRVLVRLLVKVSQHARQDPTLKVNMPPRAPSVGLVPFLMMALLDILHARVVLLDTSLPITATQIVLLASEANTNDTPDKIRAVRAPVVRSVLIPLVPPRSRALVAKRALTAKLVAPSNARIAQPASTTTAATPQPPAIPAPPANFRHQLVPKTVAAARLDTLLPLVGAISALPSCHVLLAHIVPVSSATPAPVVVTARQAESVTRAANTAQRANTVQLEVALTALNAVAKNALTANTAHTSALALVDHALLGAWALAVVPPLTRAARIVAMVNTKRLPGRLNAPTALRVTTLITKAGLSALPVLRAGLKL